MLKFNLFINKTKSIKNIIGAYIVECKEYKTILTAPLYPHLQTFHLVVVAVRPFP